MGRTQDAASYRRRLLCVVSRHPFSNEIIELIAERAIVSEKLGKHAATDVLAVSFSANDYVATSMDPIRLKRTRRPCAPTSCSTSSSAIWMRRWGCKTCWLS